MTTTRHGIPLGHAVTTRNTRRPDLLPPEPCRVCGARLADLDALHGVTTAATSAERRTLTGADACPHHTAAALRLAELDRGPWQDPGTSNPGAFDLSELGRPAAPSYPAPWPVTPTSTRAQRFTPLGSLGHLLRAESHQHQADHPAARDDAAAVAWEAAGDPATRGTTWTLTDWRQMDERDQHMPTPWNGATLTPRSPVWTDHSEPHEVLTYRPDPARTGTAAERRAARLAHRLADAGSTSTRAQEAPARRTVTIPAATDSHTDHNRVRGTNAAPRGGMTYATGADGKTYAREARGGIAQRPNVTPDLYPARGRSTPRNGPVQWTGPAVLAWPLTPRTHPVPGRPEYLPLLRAVTDWPKVGLLPGIARQSATLTAVARPDRGGRVTVPRTKAEDDAPEVAQPEPQPAPTTSTPTRWVGPVPEPARRIDPMQPIG